MLLCSDQPIRVHHPRVVADNVELSDYFLGQYGIVPEWLPYALLDTETQPLLADKNGPLNTLDRPVLEFEMARLRDRGIPAFKAGLRARATMARHEAMLSPVMSWKPEEVVLNAEIYQGEDSTVTAHWRNMTKGLPCLEDRLKTLRDWYWRRSTEAAKTPREQWSLAQRLAEAGQCDRAEAEFVRAAQAKPTLQKPVAVLVDCRTRAKHS